MSNQNPALVDPFSPYFLHHSEASRVPPVPMVLTGKNYHSWSKVMPIALKAKNKLPFIDGRIMKPDPDDPLFPAWDRCNNVLVSWITLTLSPEILESVTSLEVAFNLWNELKNRYKQGGLYRIAKLQEELFTFKQGDLSITAYYTKLKGIWEELDQFRSIPRCPYNPLPCVCGFGTIHTCK